MYVESILSQTVSKTLTESLCLCLLAEEPKTLKASEIYKGEGKQKATYLSICGEGPKKI